MLDYDYIKNHYKLIVIDLSRQKELDAEPKAIQQIEFVGQLKNPDNAIDAKESMFLLAISEKNQRSETKIFSRKCNSIINNSKLSRSKSYTTRQTTKIRDVIAKNISKDIKLLSIVNCQFCQKHNCLKLFNQVDLFVLG